MGFLSCYKFILVRDSHSNYSIEKVHTVNVNLPNLHIVGKVKYFFHQHTRYVWVNERGSFGTLAQLLWSHKTCDDLVDNLDGLTEEEHSEL